MNDRSQLRPVLVIPCDLISEPFLLFPHLTQLSSDVSSIVRERKPSSRRFKLCSHHEPLRDVPMQRMVALDEGPLPTPTPCSLRQFAVPCDAYSIEW